MSKFLHNDVYAVRALTIPVRFFSKTDELKSRFHNDIENGGKKGICKVACECFDIHLKSVILTTN